jgi:hypothetical protein
MNTILERFNKLFSPEPFSGCWLWHGAVTSKGYGSLFVLKTAHGIKTGSAHRVSWELFRGEIPKGLLVCHKCDVRICVNPDHLFLGTNKDNTQDSVRKDRHTRGERCARTKLAREQVLQIRSDPRCERLIAKDYGLNPATVCRIKNKLRWKHL